jgi:arylsulfatase A-like enzyme
MRPYLMIFLLLLTACRSSQPLCEDCSVLIIVIDSLRADHLPCYGYDKNTAPFICGPLYETSIVFKSAYSQSSLTYPSLTSVLTGAYIEEHGIFSNSMVDASPFFPTLTQYLADQGYKTRAVVNVPFLETGMANLFFDEVVSFDGWRDKTTARNVTQEIIKGFEKNEKLFMLGHYFAVHAPYTSVEPFSSEFYEGLPLVTLLQQSRLQVHHTLENLSINQQSYLISQYDANILYVDREISRLFQFLLDEGRLDDTIIFLFADHGESLGHYVRFGNRQFGHGWGLFEEQIHVPLMVYFPGESHRLVPDIVGLIDIFPTVLESLDIPFQKRGGSLFEKRNSPLFSSLHDENWGRKGWEFPDTKLLFQSKNETVLALSIKFNSTCRIWVEGY